MKSRLASLEQMNNTLLETLSKNIEIDESFYPHFRACGSPTGIQSSLPINQHAGAALQEKNTFHCNIESIDLMQVMDCPSMNALSHSGTPRAPSGHMNTIFDHQPCIKPAELLDSHELDVDPGLKQLLSENFANTLTLENGNIMKETSLSPELMSQASEFHAAVRDSGLLMRSTAARPEDFDSPQERQAPEVTAQKAYNTFAVLSDTTAESQSSSQRRQPYRQSSSYPGKDISSPQCVGRLISTPTQVTNFSLSNSDHVDQHSKQSPFDYEESSVSNCSTPLHYAVANAHLSTVRELIVHGADVSARDKQGCAALHMCAKNQSSNDLVIIQMLVKAGALLEVRNRQDLTPLQVAAERGNEQTVKLLLALGANVNSSSAFDREE